jgi:RNA polymerase sigma-70 factor (ECF subfamily)
MSQTQYILPPDTQGKIHDQSPVGSADSSGQILIFDPDEFYRQHQARLFHAALRILRDRQLAEDAVQEAFKNIFLHMKEFRGESRMETWMTRIVVNVCLGYIRKHKVRLKGEVAIDAGENPPAAQLPDPGSDPFTATQRQELRQILQAALGQLRAIHRQVILLHDIQQRTLEEIAQMLRAPVGTIKSRLFYGRRELQTIINQLTARQAYHLL